MTSYISAPTIIINNQTIKIKPNSCKITLGLGETKVRAESAGGGSVSTITAIDVATKIGKVAFTLEPSAKAVDLVRGWKSNGNNNVVQTPDSKTGFFITFTNAALVNDPEIGLSADGEIPCEFQSDPAS